MAKKTGKSKAGRSAKPRASVGGCKLFDKSPIRLLPLTQREHDLDLSVIAPLGGKKLDTALARRLLPLARRIVKAKSTGAAVIWMMGAHVIRSGVQRYIIDLMERGMISSLALNGAGMIHDYEFSLIGATTESVAKYVVNGRFGLWIETGWLNDIINAAYRKNKRACMGYSVGKYICDKKFPNRDISLLATGYRLGIPVTVHVGIGQDIIHQHPNCDGAATGATTYNDFLRYTTIVNKLQGGAIMNFGSAVMGPEVFLKAISMCRNVAEEAERKGRKINDFVSLVCDLRELPKDVSKTPEKTHPSYYYRPWKTMLVRTVAEGGQSLYLQAHHSLTVPALWEAVNIAEKELRGKAKKA